MTIDEFDPDTFLLELNRKMANVSINPAASDVIVKDTLDHWRRHLYDDDPDICFVGVQHLRRYLTQGTSDSSHVDDLLELNILPRLKDWLQYNEHPALQFEIAWVITNIAAGNSYQTNALVENDFIPVLTEVLQSNMNTLTVKAQAGWALSNFAGESPHLREQLLEQNSLVMIALVLQDTCQDIIDTIHKSASLHLRLTIANHNILSDVKALTWSLSNMSRGGFRTANYWDRYVPAFNALALCICFEHKDVWVDACWGLSRIMYNMHDVHPFYDSVMITNQLCTRLASLLKHEDLSVIVPVLRCIINITSGPNEHSERLLETDLLDNLAHLTNPDTALPIRRDAFLVVSNLVASDDTLVKTVCDADYIIDSVVAHIHVPGHVFKDDTCEWLPTVSSAYYHQAEEWKITLESLWVVCNLTNLGSDETIQKLLTKHEKLPKLLLNLLMFQSLPNNVCVKALDVTINIIGRTNKISASIGIAANPQLQSLVQSGLADLLTSINKQHPDNEDIHKRTHVLIGFAEDCQSTSAPEIAQSNDSSSIAALFGLNSYKFSTVGANKRRVLRGQEDGDIRLIANAVHNLSITEQQS
ncbi:ARM repeat-containing protein [Hesseltinella vesiculosa]|uniref:ARM repeat-containing protein n=1 Tax=Hesseltinella vesiculosa TaxID=101127 RepID=A0A1X2GLF9_9FUNG|nr:ARM repeat-containing protein [Hesseltinella vesiculosa]